MNGTVIACIGAPGVGTSFLIKQLACKNMLPAFFEGEEGIFPPSVLEVLNSELDNMERYTWIAERTKLMLERAHAIAREGIDCYVDGDVLLLEAWLAAETGSESPVFLKTWLEENVPLKADKVIVLTASEEKIRENIRRRGRGSEQSEFIAARALRISKACIDLEKKHDHVRVLDRSDLEFTDPVTLSLIEAMIASTPLCQQ